MTPQELYKSSIEAGYSPAQVKERLRTFVKTGQVPEDPTEAVWEHLINQESGGRQSAVSPKGARGIAQVMPGTAPEAASMAGVEFDEDAYKNDPSYNARIGRAYLREMFGQFQSPELALAAYNAGPGRVSRAGGDLSKLPAETRAYVPAIMSKVQQKQVDPDSPQDIEQAQAALSTPDPARDLYERMRAEGAKPDEIRVELRKLKGAAQPPTPTQQVVTPSQEPEQPSFDENIRRYMEGEYKTSPTNAATAKFFTDMIRGGRQLFNQVTGDDEELTRLNQEEQKTRELWNKLDPKGSGMSAADVTQLATGAFGLGPLLRGGVVGGAATGAALGALQPTAGDESRLGNSALGGVIGGTIPAAGKLIKSVVGRPSQPLQEISGRLRGMGVEVPKGMEYNSPMGSVLKRISGETSEAMDDSIAGRLSEAIGAPRSNTRFSNELLEQQKGTVGSQIGNLFKGTSTKLDKSFLGKLGDIDKNYRLAGTPSAGDRTSRMVQDLSEIYASRKPMTGEQYQAIRREIGNRVSQGGAEGQAARDIRQLLDDTFFPLVDQAKAKTLRGQYRLASVLRAGAGIPDQGMSMKQLFSKIETAAGKGNIDPQVRQMVKDLGVVNPNARVRPGDFDDAVSAAERAVQSSLESRGVLGAASAALRGLAGPTSRSFIKGRPQRLTNNEWVNRVLLNILRQSGIQATDNMGEQ